MKSIGSLVAAAIVGVIVIQSAFAADPAEGKKLADKTCQACHGINGVGIADMYPNLAGQKAAYLEAQLKAFRDGTRQNPIMAPMAKQLTDTEIANVAAYYASLNPNQ